MIKLVGFCSFILMSVSMWSQILVDKVVAQVGSEYILLSDLEKQYSYMKETQALEDDVDAKCQILESIMSQKVMVDQARLDSIAVTDDEVEAQLDYRIESILRQMNGNVELFESYYNKTIDEVKIEMRDEIRNMLLAERMQSSLMDNIYITPTETHNFFNSIPVDSLPLFNAEVEVAEIVSVPLVNDEQRAIALEKARDIKKQLESEIGSFGELAEKYSSDPGSKRSGGDLGWQKRGIFVPEFEAAAYSLEKDQLSDPIETEFGFHIIQLLDRRGNNIHVRHILISPRITDEDINLAKEKLEEVKQEIDSDSISFEGALQKYGYKKAESFINNGRLTNPYNGTTFFETKDLAPDIYFAIENIEAGEVTDPIEYYSPSNKVQYRLIKLLSRTKPHRANLNDDYDKIQHFAKENKKNEYFAKWIQEKTKDSYVKIAGNFETCPNLQYWLDKGNN